MSYSHVLTTLGFFGRVTKLLLIIRDPVCPLRWLCFMVNETRREYNKLYQSRIILTAGILNRSQDFSALFSSLLFSSFLIWFKPHCLEMKEDNQAIIMEIKRRGMARAATHFGPMVNSVIPQTL